MHRPDGCLEPADVVNLGYVVNVIDDPAERIDTLRRAWQFARCALMVSSRLSHEQRAVEGANCGDGIVSRHGTFQKFFGQGELRAWIDSTLAVSSVAAGPGVFFVFRRDADRRVYESYQHRRRAHVPTPRQADVLFEQHKALLESLIEFVAERGRLPIDGELRSAQEIAEALGSLRRAFGVIRRVTGPERWDAIAQERTQDLLVYLAFDRFGGRPKVSQLPAGTQEDVKAFCGTYTRACADADRLLFSAGDIGAVSAACGQVKVGKILPDALYIHESALGTLPPILRVYEGCARRYIGAVDGANIIKLSRAKPQVSYLAYPDFDKKPHPALLGSLKVPLQTFTVSYKDFSETENPPVLHRKETFVAADYPGRDKFAKLTEQEEAAGLFADTTTIGRQAGWAEALARAGVALRGHRVVRVRKATRRRRAAHTA